MPLTKVDRENRTVSGFATLDNVDTQGDVVLAEASAKAFARFRGNIREMHQPIAAGRVVDFQEEEYYHNGEFYRGIYVTAYVSKGAQDTWEKVLDGTLTGFSIGGNIIESETEWVKDANANIRFVKDYDLVELSLVDNPANQLANVFSVTKAADGNGSIIKGMVADVTLENVFWCSNDEIAKPTCESKASCAVCGNTMENIGWFEAGDDNTEKVREVVTKFLSRNQNVIETPANDEGGVEMGEKVEKAQTETEEVVAETEVEETPAEVAPAEAAVEEETVVEEASEENAVELDIEKMFGELHDAVKSAIEKNTVEIGETIETVNNRVDEIKKSFEDATSELDSKLSEFGERLDSIKSSSGEVAKRLEALEGETAVRKSAELDSAEITKSRKTESSWSGAFLSDFS